MDRGIWGWGLRSLGLWRLEITSVGGGLILLNQDTCYEIEIESLK